MSLFKSRDFWSTTCDTPEQFDQQSLKTSRLNTEDDYVITGSHSGILRIYKPSGETPEDGKIAGFRATDLLIEKPLGQPILQIADGKLTSGSTQVQLATLHPKSVTVFALTTKEGATAHGNQNSLQLIYEHKLRRSAFSFLVGPFGGSQNRDFLCVQSLDGLLTFFEQESFSFCCFLPDFLLPGPFGYLFRADVFLVSSSDWCLHAYRYKKLSEAGQNSCLEDEAGRKAEGCWELNLGESLVDLRVVKHACGKETVVALGERNFYGVSEGGKVLFMKHLEYSPLCFSSYVLDEGDKIMTLIVSETSTLLIYQMTTLKWSANLSFLPVSIERAFLQSVKGAVVTLSEEGHLSCSYLGTEPSLFVAPPLGNQQMDFEEAIADLEKYEEIIRSKENLIAKFDEQLALSMRLSEDVQKYVLESDEEVDALKMTVEVAPLAHLEEVQILVSAVEGFVVIPPVCFFPSLSEKECIEVLVYLDGGVCSLQIDVLATFMTNMGVPKVSAHVTRLPFSFIAEPCAPQKEALNKIVLNINKPPVPLNVLFSEFAGDQLANNSAAFAIKRAAEPVTILLAKASERYRIQSDSLLSLNVVVEEIVDRLKKHYQNDLTISFNPSLPIPEILEHVNRHFSARQHFVALEKDLALLAAQFRLIQKRLIAKFKVKHPIPLTNLELLLDDTFDTISETTTKLQAATEDLRKAQRDLSSVLTLVLNLIKLMDVNEELLKSLEAALCPLVRDVEGQSWEDTLDASTCFLLRTVLAKTEKDKLRAPHTSFEEIKDIAKVEKHLTLVLERVCKKGAPLEEEAPNEIVEKVPEKESVPVGSQIGQASTRVLSARKGLLQKRQRLQQLRRGEES